MTILDTIKNIPQMHSLYKMLFLNGKGLRGNMTKMVSDHLDISNKDGEKLAQIIEYIHHASLLHDDVIDSSPQRRGKMSLWKQFSIKQSILGGDYLLATIAVDVSNMNNLPLMQLTATALKNLILGEWMQDSLKDSETMDKVKTMHELKTSSLFQWCLRAPFLFVNKTDEKLHAILKSIGLLQGVVFQRRDDLLDFDIRNKEKKISFQDLVAGSLNSFAVFLSQKKDDSFCIKLKLCRNLKAVQELVGDKELEIALQEFDSINDNLIRDCENQVERLVPHLTEDEKPLIESLKKEIKKLYWREK